MIRRWLVLVMVWFRRVFFVTTPIPEPEAFSPSPEPAPAPVEAPPSPSEPPPDLPPPPVESATIVKPAKWVKPKGEKPKAEPRPKPDPKPKAESKPKAPRPQLKGEDPEQWGQYYFRDAILDQLDTYFTYLRRMKVNARHAYDLHSRLGIHILPQSAVQSFDNWRQAQDEDELLAWWKSHRPSFGAVSYGIDADSLREDRIKVCDLSPEQWDQIGGHGNAGDLNAQHRMATVARGPDTVLPDGHRYETGLIWVGRRRLRYDDLLGPRRRTPPYLSQAAQRRRAAELCHLGRERYRQGPGAAHVDLRDGQDRVEERDRRQLQDPVQALGLCHRICQRRGAAGTV